MNPILAALMSSTANTLLPVAEGLAAEAFGKLLTSGENLLAALEGKHPVVAQAANTLAGAAVALTGQGGTGAASTVASAAVSEVASAVTPLISAGIAKLIAAAPTGTVKS